MRFEIESVCAYSYKMNEIDEIDEIVDFFVREDIFASVVKLRYFDRSELSAIGLNYK